MPNCHCGKRALYNVFGQKAVYCRTHKTPDMINVSKKTCEFKDCMTRPSFGIRGGKCQFCVRHKTADMIDLLNDSCEYEDCTKQPIFNVKGEIKGRFCTDHKLDGMVDVKNKLCEVADCTSRAHYDQVGKKGRFCSEHKEKGMINITNRTCESDSCPRQPMFNIKGEKKGRFCSEHKLDGMMDVKNKLCEHDECVTRAHFDVVGGKGRFCSVHKLDGMVNVKDKCCIIDDCTKYRTYNIKGQRAKFCLAHKTDNMVNVQQKLCTIDICTSPAQYGFLGKDNVLCNIHKQKGMLLKPKQKCSSCNQLGTFQTDSERFCEKHAPATADNLGIATCTSCGLDDILIAGLCETCDPTVIQTRMKAKEIRVRTVLEDAGFKFIHDRVLESYNCGRERPDFQIDCGTHFVYVEVDEHQHRSYACECEQTRMINLAEVRGVPVTFIRYNPDLYDPIKGQKMIRLEQREKKLVEWVQYAMDHHPSEMDAVCAVLYLFYDEYDTQVPEWHALC